MSEEGVFVHFREYLAAIEKAICDHNINQVRYLARNISDVTSNIFNRSVPRVKDKIVKDKNPMHESIKASTCKTMV